MNEVQQNNQPNQQIECNLSESSSSSEYGSEDENKQILKFVEREVSKQVIKQIVHNPYLDKKNQENFQQVQMIDENLNFEKVGKKTQEVEPIPIFKIDSNIRENEAKSEKIVKLVSDGENLNDVENPYLRQNGHMQPNDKEKNEMIVVEKIKISPIKCVSEELSNGALGQKIRNELQDMYRKVIISQVEDEMKIQEKIQEKEEDLILDDKFKQEKFDINHEEDNQIEILGVGYQEPQNNDSYIQLENDHDLKESFQDQDMRNQIRSDLEMKEENKVELNSDQQIQNKQQNFIMINASMKRNITKNDLKFKSNGQIILNYQKKSKQSKNEIINKIGDFFQKAQSQIQQNRGKLDQSSSLRFPYAKAARIVHKDDSPDQIIQLNPLTSMNKLISTSWKVKNASHVGWDLHQTKKFTLFTTMVEPQGTKVIVKTFDYDMIQSMETINLNLELDFQHFDFVNTKTTEVALMFRILDEKNIIIGDAKEDHMLLFIKIENEQKQVVQNSADFMNLSSEQHLALASILLDEGYSDRFDRCLKAVQCCSGDVNRAREMLSKITITENQYY